MDDLKRWHWAVIGLICGLVLGYAYRFVYRDIDPGYSTLRQPERVLPLLVAQDFETGRPIIEDLVIYPLQEESSKTQLVTFRMREVYRFRDEAAGISWTRTRWEPRQIWVDVPFDPEGPPGNTFADHVAGLRARGLLAGAQVSSAWWSRPVPGLALFTLGGVLLVGGVWPTLLNILVGAGLGSRKKKENYDLSRFGEEKEGSAEAARRRDMTDDEQDQLAAVTAELEASVGPAGEGKGVSPSDGDAPDTSQSHRALVQDAPVEQPPGPETEDRSYEGQYYPVARKRSSDTTS